MRCLGVLGGEFIGEEPLRIWAESCSLVLAADGGYRHLSLAGIRPDAIVGDLDSVHEDALSSGLKVIPYPDQDRSDAEKLLIEAQRQGAREVVMICAHGGRIDHLLAVFFAAARVSVSVRFVFPFEHGLMVRAGFEGRFSTGAEKRISLLPVAGECHISLSGCAWPISQRTLKPDDFWSLSNASTEESISLEVHQGQCLLMVEADPGVLPAW